MHFPADWLLRGVVVISKLCYIRSLFLFESKGTLPNDLASGELCTTYFVLQILHLYSLCVGGSKSVTPVKNNSSEDSFCNSVCQKCVPSCLYKSLWLSLPNCCGLCWTTPTLCVPRILHYSVANLNDCSPNLGLMTSVCHTFTAFTLHAGRFPNICGIMKRHILPERLMCRCNLDARSGTVTITFYGNSNQRSQSQEKSDGAVAGVLHWRYFFTRGVWAVENFCHQCCCCDASEFSQCADACHSADADWLIVSVNCASAMQWQLYKMC